MQSAGPPNTVTTAVHRIKQEIDSLTEQQSKALEMAIYLGMAPEEAREYDQRRKKIVALVQELAEMQKAQ